MEEKNGKNRQERKIKIKKNAEEKNDKKSTKTEKITTNG